ncbi:MAG: hypothetical protein ACR2IF_12240 [Terriglobales bacterium]
MRKFLLVVALVCLCAATVAAQNEGRVSNGWACAKPDKMTSIDVGDEPGHSYAISQFKCTSTKGEWAGVREKEGTATEFEEIKGGKLTGHGIFLETFANGDTAKFSYQPSGTVKDGKVGTLADKWQFVSGTGKLKGTKASGNCTGNGNPDGGSMLSCTGTYTLAK